MKKKKKIVIAFIILIIVFAAFACGWFLATKQEQKELENIGMIQLNCEDQTYQPVIGGEYDLRNEDGIITSSKVGNDGTIKFYEVPVGKYTLVSTSIPEGYELPYPKTEVEIKKGQKITVTKTYKRIVPRLVLTVEDEDGKPLKNTKIELYDEEEYILDTGYTNKDGIYTFNFETTGTYYMQQLEAPEGYVIDETLYRLRLDEDENFTFYTTIVNQEDTGEESLSA